MKKIEIKIAYTEYESISELNEQDQILVNKAKEAVVNAYAPYSNFKVGAAVSLQNGEIVLGNNQENGAFPSGLCAERVAIFAAASKYKNVAIHAIAITCKTELFDVHEPITPCGACRQSILEYELKQQKKIKLILTSESGKVKIVDSISDLLPLYFKAENLSKIV